MKIIAKSPNTELQYVINLQRFNELEVGGIAVYGSAVYIKKNGRYLSKIGMLSGSAMDLGLSWTIEEFNVHELKVYPNATLILQPET